MKLKKIFSILITAFLFSFAAYAEYNSYGIPDSAEIRRTIVDSWFKASISDIRRKNSEIRKNQLGHIFQIRMEERVDCCAIIVSPQSYLNVDLVSENGTETVKMAVYPEGGPGSFVLYKDKTSGKAVKIQWYFNPDAEVYLEFYEAGSKTYVDMIVCSSYAAKAVPLSVKFEQLYESSFQDVLRWTKLSLPWNKVNVIPEQYKESLQMVAVIQENLSKIDFAENACYDEKDKLCSFITGKELTLKDEYGREYIPEPNGRLSLSGAGFTKWIADGIIRNYTGANTKIAEVIQPTLNYNPTGKSGVISQKYSLSFALDLCRNLAVKALNVRSSRDYSVAEGGVDVTENFFVAENVNGRLINSTGYLKDTGYQIKKLKSILYVLAVTEPSYFYLGAIKQPSIIKHDEMVFNNSVALFPYFDDSGHFDCFVFMNGKQIPLNEFINTYEKSYIHLERVKATNYFSPKS